MIWSQWTWTFCGNHVGQTGIRMVVVVVLMWLQNQKGDVATVTWTWLTWLTYPRRIYVNNKVVADVVVGNKEVSESL